MTILSEFFGSGYSMNKKPVVIAHRGASGYLPELSLPGLAAACAFGADYVELDAIMTKDDRVIVFHDHYLDAMTNVAGLFPGKKRNDGWHYAIDFTLAEIKTLRLHERIHTNSGKQMYPSRFPADSAVHFEIPTLEEVIELIQGLNASMGRSVGIYIEPKGPSYHRQGGKNIEEALLHVFKQYGYASRDSRCYIQSFEPESITYMRHTLKSDLKMVQLIGDTAWEETPGVDYTTMRTPGGLDAVARYADLVGPWMSHLVIDEGKGKPPTHTRIVEWAHERSLDVHTYTFRADVMPSYAAGFDDLLDIFFNRVGVDGIFTDFPDRAIDFLHARGLR